jgi:hypothetical protein
MLMSCDFAHLLLLFLFLFVVALFQVYLLYAGVSHFDLATSRSGL